MIQNTMNCCTMKLDLIIGKRFGTFGAYLVVCGICET